MTAFTNVTCNGCRLCCLHDLILLHPECGDRIEDYDCVPAMNPLTGKQGFALRRNENSECIYLGPDGCTIHDRAPVICREFDCRALYRKLGRTERRSLISRGLIDKKVLDAGRERLK